MAVEQDRGYATPCLVFTGSPNSQGYARISASGGAAGWRLGHVVAWEAVNGPVPAGLELDHLCRVTLCVRWDHLEPVTHRVNMGRSPRLNPEACPHGHAYDEANTYWEWAKLPAPPHWHRRCKTCDRTRARARRAGRRSGQ